MASREDRTSATVHKLYDVIREGITQEEVMGIYREWAETYEEDVTQSEISYNGPIKGVHEMVRLFGDNRESRILDVGAGTGLIGAMLTKEGFTNIDALDGSEHMLKLAKAKGIYKNTIQQLLGPDRLNIADDTYAGMIGVGCWHNGHIKGDCFYELARIIKPNGWFVMVLDESDLQKFYISDIRRLESLGKWKLVCKTQIDKYCVAGEGTVVSLRVS